jgi:protein ImuB
LQLEWRAADEETTPALISDFAGQVTFERTLRLPVAMRDSKVFLKLLQLELAAHPPSAPVTKVGITAEPAPPRSAQRGLFLPISPEPERLEITLARISGIVGERRAGIARLLDSHRPDSFRMERFVAASAESKSVKHTRLSYVQDSGLTLRMFRPPQRLRVRLSGGRPANLTPIAKQTDRVGLHGNVLWSAGPWRSSGDWWREGCIGNEKDFESFGREEWDVALANSGTNVALYSIYQDLASGHWFVGASYD